MQVVRCWNSSQRWKLNTTFSRGSEEFRRQAIQPTLLHGCLLLMQFWKQDDGSESASQHTWRMWGWPRVSWKALIQPIETFTPKLCWKKMRRSAAAVVQLHFSFLNFYFLKRPSVGVYDRVSRFYDIPVCASRFYRSPCYVVCVHGLLSLELASALQRRWLPYFKQTQNCWNVFSTISAYKLFYLKSLIAQTSNAVSFTLLFFQKLKLYVSFRILNLWMGHSCHISFQTICSDLCHLVTFPLKWWDGRAPQAFCWGIFVLPAPFNLPPLIWAWAGKLWSSRLRPLPQSFAEKRCVVPLQQLFSSTFHFSIFNF